MRDASKLGTCSGALLASWIRLSEKKLRAAIAQLGERQTEDLEVPGSIPGLGISWVFQIAWESLAE